MGSLLGSTTPKLEDITGDGIQDMYLDKGGRTTYFIGKGDGSLVPASKGTTLLYDEEKGEYLFTKDGEKYFFNGEYYELVSEE